MGRTVVVSGTGTGVGKTWVAARIIEMLRVNGVEVHARKPVQSHDPGDTATDRDVLAAATGEPPDVVCPAHRSYAIAMAPPMAAETLGREPFSISDLVTEMSMPKTGIVLIEGAGGPRSPLADDGDTVRLADEIDADLILLVASPGLGTINEVLLSTEAFGTRAQVVFINGFDDAHDLHVRNHKWLVEVSGLDIVTTPDGFVERLSNGG